MLFARTSQGHALVQQTLIAHHGGFANHHAHAVVDEHPLADARPRVDLHAGEQAAQLTEHSR